MKASQHRNSSKISGRVDSSEVSSTVKEQDGFWDDFDNDSSEEESVGDTSSEFSNLSVVKPQQQVVLEAKSTLQNNRISCTYRNCRKNPTSKCKCDDSKIFCSSHYSIHVLENPNLLHKALPLVANNFSAIVEKPSTSQWLNKDDGNHSNQNSYLSSPSFVDSHENDKKDSIFHESNEKNSFFHESNKKDSSSEESHEDYSLSDKNSYFSAKKSLKVSEINQKLSSKHSEAIQNEHLKRSDLVNPKNSKNVNSELIKHSESSYKNLIPQKSEIHKQTNDSPLNNFVESKKFKISSSSSEDDELFARNEKISFRHLEELKEQNDRKRNHDKNCKESKQSSIYSRNQDIIEQPSTSKLGSASNHTPSVVKPESAYKEITGTSPLKQILHPQIISPSSKHDKAQERQKIEKTNSINIQGKQRSISIYENSKTTMKADEPDKMLLSISSSDEEIEEFEMKHLEKELPKTDTKEQKYSAISSNSRQREIIAKLNSKLRDSVASNLNQVSYIDQSRISHASSHHSQKIHGSSFKHLQNDETYKNLEHLPNRNKYSVISSCSEESSKHCVEEPTVCPTEKQGKSLHDYYSNLNRQISISSTEKEISDHSEEKEEEISGYYTQQKFAKDSHSNIEEHKDSGDINVLLKSSALPEHSNDEESSISSYPSIIGSNPKKDEISVPIHRPPQKNIQFLDNPFQIPEDNSYCNDPSVISEDDSIDQGKKGPIINENPIESDMYSPQKVSRRLPRLSTNLFGNKRISEMPADKEHSEKDRNCIDKSNPNNKCSAEEDDSNEERRYFKIKKSNVQQSSSYSEEEKDLIAINEAEIMLKDRTICLSDHDVHDRDGSSLGNSTISYSEAISHLNKLSLSTSSKIWKASSLRKLCGCIRSKYELPDDIKQQIGRLIQFGKTEFNLEDAFHNKLLVSVLVKFGFTSYELDEPVKYFSSNEDNKWTLHEVLQLQSSPLALLFLLFMIEFYPISSKKILHTCVNTQSQIALFVIIASLSKEFISFVATEKINKYLNGRDQAVKFCLSLFCGIVFRWFEIYDKGSISWGARDAVTKKVMIQVSAKPTSFTSYASDVYDQEDEINY